MFRCSECGKVSEPRQPQNKVVIQRREKIYADGSKGWEIVKEVALCDECYSESPFKTVQ